jgi:hypothetical protein
MSDFVWNDELVKKFVAEKIILGNCTSAKEAIEAFKEEHTKPKVEWEIVAYDYCGQAVSATNSLINFYKYPIHSVRRLSDGEAFSIGDEVEYELLNKKNYKAVIESFDAINDNMYVCGNPFSFCINIADLKKVTKPTPLFKTEDGVEIFDGEAFVYYVSNFRIRARKAKNMANMSNKRFSNENAAEEYILMNKPLLSVNDVYGIVKRGEMSGKDYVVWSAFVDTDLKDLAKEKLYK